MSDAPPQRGRPGGVAGALAVTLSVLLSSCVFSSDAPRPTLTAWPATGLVDDARVDVRAEHLGTRTSCFSVDCVLRADRYAFVPVASRDVEAPIALGR